MKFLRLAFFFAALLYCLMYIAGSMIPDKPLKVDTTIRHFRPYPSYVKKGEKPRQFKEETLPEYPDYYDPRAGHWEEFLEDCDAEGISPWSPDAEELYYDKYGN